MGLVWEHSWVTFVIVTVLAGGGAAWMSGAALARSWRPLWVALLYMLLLGAGIRFFHYALGDGQLLSLHYYFVDTLIATAAATLSHRLAQTSLMVQQYPWLYRRTSPLTWAPL